MDMTRQTQHIHDIRNGSFLLIGLTNGPIEFKQVVPFLAEQRTFKGSILGGRYSVQLMLEFAARHQIKPAIVEFPFVSRSNKCQKKMSHHHLCTRNRPWKDSKRRPRSAKRISCVTVLCLSRTRVMDGGKNYG